MVKSKESKGKFNKKEYEKKTFKHQNVVFKIEEMEEIEAYLKEKGIAKNTFIRQAVMQAIGKPIN